MSKLSELNKKIDEFDLSDYDEFVKFKKVVEGEIGKD